VLIATVLVAAMTQPELAGMRGSASRHFV